MNYNVGDKVKIKSLEWYKANRDIYGDVYCGDIPFIKSMSRYCGKVLTIERVFNFNTTTYEMLEDSNGFDWNDGMIECLVDPASDNEILQTITGNTNSPTWEHVNNAFEAGKKRERVEVAAEVLVWLKQNTNWAHEYDEGGRNENFGKIEELINVILGKE